MEALPIPFGAVATDLKTGAEIWLREGSTVEAVRASIALPALFTPVQQNGVTMVDGGLVNPVPVSLARAMGADIVIAVDLGSGKVGSHLAPQIGIDSSDTVRGEWKRQLRETLGGHFPAYSTAKHKLPTLHEVLFSSIDIMQAQIARTRLAADPPDAIVSPRLVHLHLLDFHRAKESIDEGVRAVEAISQKLREIGGQES
jgi:NTE family protein